LSVIDQIRTVQVAIRQTKAILRDFGIDYEDREVEKEDTLVLRFEGLMRRLAKARTQGEREDILGNIERLLSTLKGQDMAFIPYQDASSVEGGNTPSEKGQWIDESVRNAAIGYLLGKAVEMAGHSSNKLSEWAKNGFK
jgi:hypothetical protein